MTEHLIESMLILNWSTISFTYFFPAVCAHPFNSLREWSVEVLCNLVKCVLGTPPKLEEQNGLEEAKAPSIPSQSHYLESLYALSQIKFIDIRQKQIDCLLQLLQSNGEHFNDGWPLIFTITESACSPQNEMLIRCAFQCYQFIVSDLLSHIPPVYLGHCINTAVAFGSQLQEMNVSLTAVGLIWNVADYLHTNQQKVEDMLVKSAQQGHKFVTINVEFCRQLTPFQSLWIALFKNLR